MKGPFKVSFGDVFPYGAYVKGGAEPVRDFDRSTREQFVQARDKETGELVWQIEVLDADPAAKGALKVKIVAPVLPVLPEAQPGFPFIPVVFEGLSVTPYVNNDTKRLAYSLKAKAISSPMPRGAARKDAA